MSDFSKVHSCGHTLKGTEKFCPRCGGAVVPNKTGEIVSSVKSNQLKASWSFNKNLSWVMALIVVCGLVYALRTKDENKPLMPTPSLPSFSSPAATNYSAPQKSEPMPDSFGWFEFEAPTGPKTADGKPSLSIKIPSDHRHVRKLDGTFAPELEKPEWCGKYRLAYGVIAAEDVDKLMVVPDGNVRKALPFKDTQNHIVEMRNTQFFSTKEPVRVFAGYIRRDLPANEIPPEESEFLAKVLSE